MQFDTTTRNRAVIAVLILLVLFFAARSCRRHTPPAPPDEGAKEQQADNSLPDAASTNAPPAPSAPVVVSDSQANNSQPASPPALSLNTAKINGRVRAGSPDVNIYFSAPVDPEAIAPFISVEPSTRFKLEYYYSWAREYEGVQDEIKLLGDFKPGTTYTFTIRKGCPAKKGAVVSEDIVFTETFPDLLPSAIFADEGRYLVPDGGSARLRLRVTNTPKTTLHAYRLREGNLHAFLLRDLEGWGDDEYHTRSLRGPSVLTAEIDTSAPLNEPAEPAIDLAAHAPEGRLPRGTYLVTTEGAANQGCWNDERLVILSDIGLSLRIDDGRVLAWATSLSTAKPLAGVKVSLFSDSNAPLGDATTGEDGVADLRVQPEEGEQPFLAVASLGEDLTFLSLDDSRNDVTPDAKPPVDARSPAPDAKYEAFVYAPRDIVRPGETLPVKTVVRDLRGRLPGTFPVALRLVRPDGRVAASVSARLSALGTAEASFEVKHEWPTGGYRVETTLPGAKDGETIGALRVKVEDIVPPQIRVEFGEAPDKVHLPGDDIAVSLRAAYLFGAPAARLPFTPSARLDAVPFEPKGWDGYRFGDAARSTSLARDIPLSKQTLSDDGSSNFSFKLPDNLRPNAALRLTLSAVVMQPGGRGVGASQTRPVAPGPFYIGLRPSTEGAVRIDNPESIAVALVAPDGSAYATNRSLKVSLESIERSWNWRRDDNGRWTYVVDTLTSPMTNSTQTLEIGPDGTATLAQTFPAPGEYRLRIADDETAASSTLDFDVIQPGSWWSHAGTTTPFAVQLTPDRETYAPGDLVTLTVKAPFKGRALLTIEGGGEWRHRVVELADTATTVEFPVDDVDVPSLHATLTVLRPLAESGEPGSPIAARAIGTALVRVVKPGRALAVELDAPAEIRPQTRVAVSARVLDGTRPESGAEVTFAAVDEGVCLLTRFKTPDPLAWANAPRWRPLKHYDLYRRLLPFLGSERAAVDSHIGGDGLFAASRFLNPLGRSNRFRIVALWSGTVATDSNGVARAEFDVPEYTGALRIMAVAVAAARYGSAERELPVRRPVNIIPTLPRFAAPGDAFDATIEVHNTAADRAFFRLEAAAVEGTPGIGALSESLRIEPGQSAVRTLRLHAAKEVGSAKFLFRASDPATGERFYEETVELPVRPAAAYETRVLSGVLKPGESVGPGKSEPMFGATSRLVCSTRPVVDLTESLDYLVRYPYGCLEQTTSGSFPLLYLRDLAESLRPDLFQNGRCEEFVRAGIARVLSMQRYDGGFAYWPDARDTSEWCTLYATHFLLEAKKAGYDVPAAALKEALEHICGRLSNPGLPDTPSEQGMRAYAAFVASLGGRVSAARPWTSRLFEKRDELPRYARAMLAAALIAGGRPQDAAVLLDSEAPAPKDDAEDERDYFDYYLFGSRARDVAIALSAQCDLDPDAPRAAELAQRLLSFRDATRARWYTTQENAMALLSLGKYVRATLASGDGAAAGEFLPGARADKSAFDLSKDFSWNGDAAEGAVLRNTGEVPFRYAWAISGAPAEPPAGVVSHSMSVTREFLDGETGNVLKPHADGSYTFTVGELVAVRLTVSPHDVHVENVVVSDLLPACLEIENPSLATSQAAPAWLNSDEAKWVASRDFRDDRVLLFSGVLNDKCTYTYLARAVSAGEFVLPAPAAEAMYEPQFKARGLSGRVIVR